MTRTPSGRGPRPTSSRPPEEQSAEKRVRPLEARVLETLPNTMFAVELTDGQKVLCRISGDLKTRGMRVVPGDRVTVELSPYDLTRGKITSRLT